ncbi:hypothetical protein Tco_0597917 [Tanacetum coccineum]
MGDHQGDDCSGDLKEKKRLETLYMTKSLANRLYLKKLYTFHMHPGKSQSEYIDEFHKLVGDLAAIDTAISDEDQVLLLLTSLPSSYDNFVKTFLYGRDTLKLEDVFATLSFRELQKMTKAKGDNDEGLEEAADSGVIYVSGSGADEYDNADVMMAMSVKELLDRIMDSGSSYYITYRRDYLVDFKEYDVGNILLGDGRECRIRGTGKIQVQMRDGSSFVLDNVRKQLGEYQTGWKIKTVIQQQNRLVKETNLTLLAKLKRSPSSAIGFKTPIDMLRFFGWLASIKQGMLEPVKVKCIFFGYRKGIVGNKLWRLDDITSKVVLYRNMGFNESGEYKKTFISSGVGKGSIQVLQGVEFEVEPQEDHTFELEPHGNIDHVVEDSNEASFAVAAVDKIYAHESLTFNNTIACEVISKWKAELKDDMNDRLDVYVLSNGCRKCNDDSDGYYWESTPGDCDVEKYSKWSCIYVVGSQEYQMVCMRPDIASADVGMLDGCDRGLQTDVQVFVDFGYTMGRSITVMGRLITRYGFMIQGCAESCEAMMLYMMALSTTEAGYITLTKAAKEAIGLKGLVIESEFELKIVAGIATGALSKAIPSPRFQHRGAQKGRDSIREENRARFKERALFLYVWNLKARISKLEETTSKHVDSIEKFKAKELQQEFLIRQQADTMRPQAETLEENNSQENALANVNAFC